MGVRICFCRATVNQLTDVWQRALRRGDRRVVQRATALLLLAEQVPVARVAARVAAGDATVYGWLRAFLAEQFASLVYRTSPGRPAKLTPRQKQRLRALVVAGPEAAGYASGCWNSAVVQELIQREFGVLYSVPYVAELLKNLGFSYQKARFVSAHLDEGRREHWRAIVWPAILRQARHHGALLLFGDEASFAQWGSLGYTWAVRGEQPLVRTCGRRKGYKVFGLIDYFSGRLFAHGHDGRFTAESYCAFLATVLAATTQPLVLVQDGARYHTAQATRDFFAAHAARLTVYQLPSYSPEYNPIEHLWRNIKRQNTHNRYFPTFATLTAAVATALAHFRGHPAAVKQLMGTYLDQMAALAETATLTNDLAPAA
ncbi:MAG: IS630-like element ISDra3 family transposase [Candidatus Dormibacteria bacterium]